MADGSSVRYDIPGPSHTNVPPSPVVQATDTGVAVAVAVTVPTEAVTEYRCQISGAIHSQVGRLTTAVGDGLNGRSGSGSVSEFSPVRPRIRTDCRSRRRGLVGEPDDAPVGGDHVLARARIDVPGARSGAPGTE